MAPVEPFFLIASKHLIRKNSPPAQQEGNSVVSLTSPQFQNLKPLNWHLTSCRTNTNPMVTTSVTSQLLQVLALKPSWSTRWMKKKRFLILSPGINAHQIGRASCRERV